MGGLLARDMTPEAMVAHYNTGGKISDIMRVTGKDYETVIRTLKAHGAELKAGGHGRG